MRGQPSLASSRVPGASSVNSGGNSCAFGVCASCLKMGGILSVAFLPQKEVECISEAQSVWLHEMVSSCEAE